MDDATINRAVAERCGWTTKTETGLAADFRGYITVAICRDAQGGVHRNDFATSLDAMAEAEATYTGDECSRAMWEIAKERAKEPLIGLEWWLRIPARTRALAFLEATKNRSVSND